MDNDALESLLRGLPTARLSAAAEAQLITALHAAGSAADERGLRRPIRLWQALAACAAVAVLSVGLTIGWQRTASRHDRNGAGGGAGPAGGGVVRTLVDTALFASGTREPNRINLATWRFRDVKHNGDHE